jgi:hypothetical protein
MNAGSVQPFARYGCEKMIYDVRMDPQALYHDGLKMALRYWSPSQ